MNNEESIRETGTRATRPIKARLKSALFAGSLLLSACVTDRESPRIAIPNGFQGGEGALSGITADTQWWRTFKDEQLNQLVDEAVRGNREISIAMSRVQEARAGLDAATASLLPSAEIAGGDLKSTTSYPPQIRNLLPDIEARSLALQTSWEVDLFGRNRAAKRAAGEQVAASVDLYRAALLLSISDLAEQYFQLRGRQERSRLLDQLLASNQHSTQLATARVAAGVSDRSELDNVNAAFQVVEAEDAALKSAIIASKNRIAVLTGSTPGLRDPRIDENTDWTATPIDVPLGQPVDLLRRRPDLLAADAQLKEAGYRQDEARAVQFPQLVLSAALGSQWTDVNAADIGRARFSNLSALFAFPIFEGGRIQAGIRAADARQREAVAFYEGAILKALEDVNSANARLNGDKARRDALQLEVAAKSSLFVRAQTLIQAGEIDRRQMLGAEQALIASRIELSNANTDYLINVVALYRALGGGWDLSPSKAQPDPVQTTGPASSPS